MLFLVTILLVFITQFLLPDWWWICMVDCSLAAILVGKHSFNSFFSGFLGVLLVWLGYMLFINNQNEGLLLGRVSQMFGLRGEWLIAVIALLGGLAGGMSSLTGYYFKDMLKKVDD